ncbi:MAG: TatD family hydrolase [Ottowia sp.]
MFTDSHCHLNDPGLAQRLPEVLAAMQAAQVTRALCISTSMEELPAVQALAQSHASGSGPRIWASAGLHPDYEGMHEPTLDELLAAAAHPRVVAIGETGLDYYQMQERKGGRSVADLDWQRERFRTHIRAAQAARLPLVIHTRASAADTLAILREEGEAGPQRAGGVFHCFTENREVARAALDLGYYISFSGIVTFKNAHDVHESARYVPDERLLIETDSPYLAPVPHRGKPNSPAWVPHVAARLAELRGVSAEHIARISSDNFDRLFAKALT